MKTTDLTERAIYASICRNDGIPAREIAKDIARHGAGNGGNPPVDRHTVNQYLYRSPFMRELCYRDDGYLWHGLIRQMRPHLGLADFCGWYGTVKEFLDTLGKWVCGEPVTIHGVSERLTNRPVLTNGRRITRITRDNLYASDPGTKGIQDWVLPVTVEYTNEFERW